VEGEGKGLTYLHDVTQEGFRLTTRQWAPDGPYVPGQTIVVRTAPIYEPGRHYRLLDHSLLTGKTAASEVQAGADGRITVRLDGAGRQISFVGPGTGGRPPVLLPLTSRDKLRLPPGVELPLPIRIYNPRGVEMTRVRLQLSTEYPTVQILGDRAEVESLAPGAAVDLSQRFRVRLTSGGGYFAPARLRLQMTYDEWREAAEDIDILVIPEQIPRAGQVEILDGRSMVFKMFRQAGNQGGGGAVDVKVTEGKGNGNGVLEPGEEATFWIRVEQGMDPFDQDNWHRCKVYCDSPWLVEVGDIQEQKQREWTSAKERTSLVRLSPETPKGLVIPLLLSNETWSFHFTPDVRFGREKLYQAFQFHQDHLHRHEIATP
jgi:hypothetical protein